MANVLSLEKQTFVIGALCEGMSIRSAERLSGVHRDTIMRLSLRVGNACERIMDEQVVGLKSTRIEVDEIWGFINKKKKNLGPLDSIDYGDVWTFISIDADSKLIANYRVGKRDEATTNDFIDDLSIRLADRVQLSSDGLATYEQAVRKSFDVDGVAYGQLVKTFSTPPVQPTGEKKKDDQVEIIKRSIFGRPDMEKVSTAYVERQNLTLRMHCRRLTRLTNAFSKKLDNFKAAVAMSFVYYNFVKFHSAIRMTPAMAAGIAREPWTVADIVKAAT